MRLGFLSVFDLPSTVVVHALALHFDTVLLVEFQDGLCVDHREQYIGEVVALHLGTQRAEPTEDAVHGDCAHTLKNVVNVLGHGGIGEERFVYHYRAEAALVLLLQYQDALRHVQLVGVRQIEGFCPSRIGFHESHDLPYLRTKFVHGCRCSHEGVEEHLEYLV